MQLVEAVEVGWDGPIGMGWNGVKNFQNHSAFSVPLGRQEGVWWQVTKKKNKKTPSGHLRLNLPSSKSPGRTNFEDYADYSGANLSSAGCFQNLGGAEFLNLWNNEALPFCSSPLKGGRGKMAELRKETSFLTVIVFHSRNGSFFTACSKALQLDRLPKK